MAAAEQKILRSTLRMPPMKRDPAGRTLKNCTICGLQPVGCVRPSMFSDNISSLSQ
jgi:hypothetical protein